VTAPVAPTGPRFSAPPSRTRDFVQNPHRSRRPARKAGRRGHRSAPEEPMTRHAHGPFDVKLAPQKADHPQAGQAGIGRMSIDKQFHGDLEAGSAGEMLAIRTEVADSAGYVAIERVTGTLHGRAGTFVLQHSSTMNRGVPQQHIDVVPDSGSGELTGLSGTMTVTIAAGGAHSYDFAYTLPEPA
jgi:hypothetical protein